MSTGPPLTLRPANPRGQDLPGWPTCPSGRAGRRPLRVWAEAIPSHGSMSFRVERGFLLAANRHRPESGLNLWLRQAEHLKVWSAQVSSFKLLHHSRFERRLVRGGDKKLVTPKESGVRTQFLREGPLVECVSRHQE